MRKEKVNFPKAKSKHNNRKMKLNFPIELYYSKISELYILIGIMIAIGIMLPTFSKTPAFSDNIWLAIVMSILGIMMVCKLMDFGKSMQYENPNIIIEKDCLYLLYDDYVLAEFDKMEYIEITSKKHSRGGTEYFLTMTIAEEYRAKGKYVNYSMRWGFFYLNGKSIDAYQAFDLIWQAFWNYHEETNHPLRIRKKEEWDW